MSTSRTTTKKRAGRALAPMHPGEFLREVVLPATGVPKTRVAAMLGLSRQSLYDILNERAAVRAVTALRL